MSRKDKNKYSRIEVNLPKMAAHKCSLCDFSTDIESELYEHQMLKHAASADKFLS